MARPQQPEARARTALLGAAALVLLLITVGLGAFLGAMTRAQFREIEASWSAYAGDAGQKGVWISEIRGHLGYGGIIHHFKNYVLRQDRVYLDSTLAQIARFKAVTAAYLAEPLDPAERAALEVIVATIRDYEARLPVAIEAATNGWDVARTDRMVRVDDRAALRALERLEAIWQANRQGATGRIVRAVAEGQALIWIGFLSLAALVMAALAIGFLLILLLRDMRRAMVRLSEELDERRRLEASEGRLAEAVEQSPATIFITDMNARILYANRRFEQITGWTRAEVEGKTPRFLQSGDAGPEVYAEIRARLGRGESWHGIFRNRRKDGGSYWAETTILPLRAPDGTVQNFIGIAEDVTEKRHAREQVARAQKLEAVGLLAGGIAHDFNNILTTIVGAAHLAALDAPEGSDLAGEVEQIDIAARRAQSLVRQLLTFARREPGRPQPVDLGATIAEVARLLRASIPPTVTLDAGGAAGTPVMVMADPTQLHQILMNLGRNAAEAIGGAHGTIAMRAEAFDGAVPEGLAPRPGGWVHLTVADDGPGMSPETRAHIFDPFFTTKPLGKGSGLGLAVVAGLVDEMGGQIAVESAPGAGARFMVILPGAAGMTAMAAEARSAPPRGHERLLIVDDETEIAATFRRVLSRLGYRVEAYTSAPVALERMRADPMRADLVISDMVMPEMSGEELVLALRALRPDLPVVFCTGYNPAGLRLPGPVAVVLDKPVDPADLARAVRGLLDAAGETAAR
ncbi:MAG: PAS domain S-box protein [Thermohalobaculum sp.]|nr:PAS domain S-box protein [Thermohalobaculum sp.]